MEGRQFVGSYGDGALVTWNSVPKAPNKPHSVVFPHGKKNKETNKVEPCDPIEKVRGRQRERELCEQSSREEKFPSGFSNSIMG